MSTSSMLVRPDEALRKVLQSAQPLAPKPVPLLQSVGLCLAEDVRADRDYPPFDRAMMDGYAVRLADAEGGKAVPIVGQVAAGQEARVPLDAGNCIEIMTGAPCPEGAEAIVPVELAHREGDLATLPRRLRFHQHIALRGSECLAGTVVLRAGEVLTPLAIGVLASVGLKEVLVIPPPSIGILITGNELVGCDESPQPSQIRDSNGPMLAAMSLEWGVAPTRIVRATDELRSIANALDEMADCNLVVLTGGVSMGRYDVVKASLREIGAEVVFHKVSQKPGKPLLFARRDRQLLFGLPGNPLAVHLCFHRYVSAAIRRCCGVPDAMPARAVGQLMEPIRLGGERTWFVLGRAEQTARATNEWRLWPLTGRSSADLFGVSRANCYLIVPPGDGILAVGASPEFEWLAIQAPGQQYAMIQDAMIQAKS